MNHTAMFQPATLETGAWMQKCETTLDFLWKCQLYDAWHHICMISQPYWHLGYQGPHLTPHRQESAKGAGV